MRSVPFVVFAIALPLIAQVPPPKFGEKIEVNLVLLDAIVTDSRGNQILGLDKSDFAVKENGVEQPVDSLEYFTNRQLLTAPEEKAPFKVERIHEERYFIFFFDKPGVPGDTELYDRLFLARNAVRDFVDREIKPGDVIAVVGHDVRLKVYSDFTNDKQRLERAIDDVVRFGRGLTTAPKNGGPSILREVDSGRMLAGTGTVYEALDALGDALRPIRGRKNVVLFSAGILEPGEEVRDGLILNESRFYQPMIRSLNRANVTVFAASLWNDPTFIPAVHQTLQRIANETNGEYFPYTVSYGPTLNRIEQINNGYYLLGYYTRHPKGTSGWQRVQVSVRNHPEMRVKAREGYAYGE